MINRTWSVMAAAMTIGLAAGLAAQTPPPDTTKQVTVTGCVHKETDVLTRNQMAGKIGMSDEWVLTRVNVNPQPAAATAPGRPNHTPPEPTGTTGNTPMFGKVYRVTGEKEKGLKTFSGRRVEVVGTFSREEDARRELTAGASSAMPDPAVRLTTENTPEITIVSITPTSGVCGAAMKVR
jgi:hypothetical protein